MGVRSVHPIPVDEVEAQVRAVVDDFDVRAVKTGMLAQPGTVERVAELKRAGLLGPLVVDPVLVSTSGHSLMSEGGIDAYREALIPLAELVTPNLREAALLCGVDVSDVRSPEDVAALGRELLSSGPRYVLVKGGHSVGDEQSAHATDLLLGPEGLTVLDSARVDTLNDHGTGCSLAAAIAAGIALGRPVSDATRDAKSYLLAALEGARLWRLGEGHGPVDHFGWGA